MWRLGVQPAPRLPSDFHAIASMKGPPPSQPGPGPPDPPLSESQPVTPPPPQALGPFERGGRPLKGLPPLSERVSPAGRGHPPALRRAPSPSPSFLYFIPLHSFAATTPPCPGARRTRQGLPGHPQIQRPHRAPSRSEPLRRPDRLRWARRCHFCQPSRPRRPHTPPLRTGSRLSWTPTALGQREGCQIRANLQLSGTRVPAPWLHPLGRDELWHPRVPGEGGQRGPRAWLRR